MEYRLIWEVPTHEWSMFHSWLVLFAIVSFISAYDKKKKGKKKVKKCAIRGMAFLSAAIICFFGNLLLTEGTCVDYYNGDYFVVEGEITDYELDAHEEFTVNGIMFCYERGAVGLTRFADINDEIRGNGQYVRITYCKRETEFYGRIAKVEIAE